MGEFQVLHYRCCLLQKRGSSSSGAQHLENTVLSQKPSRHNTTTQHRARRTHKPSALYHSRHSTSLLNVGRPLSHLASTPPKAPPILPHDPPPQATSRLPHVARTDRLPRSLLSPSLASPTTRMQTPTSNHASPSICIYRRVCEARGRSIKGKIDSEKASHGPCAEIPPSSPPPSLLQWKGASALVGPAPKMGKKAVR